VRRYGDLALALVAVIVVTALYATLLATVGMPRPGSLAGHALGIIGLTLMLMTETLYSLRKRAMRRPWGTMRAWLRFHIVTGIVGGWLVFLHAAGSFQGLAGWLTAMTGVVVASGFIGRYIYTAVPRTADGVMVEAQVLQAQLATLRAELTSQTRSVGRQSAVGTAGSADERVAAARLRQLERQVSALRWARRSLATWHTIHIPLGMVLFVTAFVHVAASLYYSTLLR
jgi:xanthosine utilization system XapX-like protein